MRVKMIFQMQSKRFACFFTWLIVLSLIAITTIAILLAGQSDGKLVACSADGQHWEFQHCGTRMALSLFHTVTTM